MTSVEPDEVHDIDPDAALDLTGDELVDEWRGVNVEDVEEVTGGLAGLLRSRSRALLSDLMRPHHGALVLSSLLIAVAVAARLAMPWLVQRGIDDGIPPLLDGGSGDLRPLMTVVIARPRHRRAQRRDLQRLPADRRVASARTSSSTSASACTSTSSG